MESAVAPVDFAAVEIAFEEWFEDGGGGADKTDVDFNGYEDP